MTRSGKSNLYSTTHLTAVFPSHTETYLALKARLSRLPFFPNSHHYHTTINPGQKIKNLGGSNSEAGRVRMLMGGSAVPSLLLLLLTLLISFSIPLRAANQPIIKGIDLDMPSIDVVPSPFYGRLSSHDSKEVLFCDRIKVSGHSRLKLGSYASSFRVTLAPSPAIPERLHSKIQICFHRNASLELCNCENDGWKTVQKGLWISVMSPYDERFVDVKFLSEISGSATVAVEEDSQRWRLLCLAVGFVLLLLAPIISSWLPFYYSTSMVIGVFLVIIILLFKGMKLLPTGRKNFLYLSIYGSVLGAGTFTLHHISVLVNSILVNFGLSEEMHNPVYILVLVGIVLAGAALGYWIVRKFVISKDGSVDAGVAQFVKWAMRIIATTFIFQSTLDTPLAMVAWVSSCAICFLTLKWFQPGLQSYSGSGSLWFQKTGEATPKHKRAEFFSKSSRKSPGSMMGSSPRSISAWSNSPVKGLVSTPAHSGTADAKDYYSAFHKTQKRKKFTKKEWEDFTKESTQQAIAEWAASPEVTNWIIDNADRIQLLPSDHGSEEEIVGSESDSTDEYTGSGKRFGLFSW